MSRPETTIFGSLSSQPASEARSLGDFSRMSNPPPFKRWRVGPFSRKAYPLPTLSSVGASLARPCSVSTSRSSVGSRAGAVAISGPVSSSRLVKHSMRISRTALSSRLHERAYETYRAGLAIGGAESAEPCTDRTSPTPDTASADSTSSNRSPGVSGHASDAVAPSFSPSHE